MKLLLDSYIGLWNENLARSKGISVLMNR